MVVLNVMYHVGSKDEHPDRTGFAHLFEHLMFGGSLNIPKYDEPLQMAGGENNAFTNTDITNYYLSLPSVNLETAMWLESDRMLDLAFSPKSLDVQRQVVVEEFRQNYLNQPYGDAWLQLRPLAYKVHPYQWPTIGKDPSHIENASMEEVKTFYQKFYTPSNAVLCLSGNFNRSEALRLLEKWFGSIQKSAPRPSLPTREPESKEAQRLELVKNVPQDAIYIAYKMCDRLHPDYFATDLISDILGNGNSSRLHQDLVLDRKLFTEIRSYITGEHDNGLFLITGKVNPGMDITHAEMAVLEHLSIMSEDEMSLYELQKVKNQVESNIQFSEMSLLNKAINLCQAEILGDVSMVNEEINKYFEVMPADIKRVATNIFQSRNSNTLIYTAEKKA